MMLAYGTQAITFRNVSESHGVLKSLRMDDRRRVKKGEQSKV